MMTKKKLKQCLQLIINIVSDTIYNIKEQKNEQFHFYLHNVEIIF
jgi:hypothetical protein